MKKLTKELVKKNEAPVKVLQFGEGNFMRGFIAVSYTHLRAHET